MTYVGLSTISLHSSYQISLQEKPPLLVRLVFFSFSMDFTLTTLKCPPPVFERSTTRLAGVDVLDQKDEGDDVGDRQWVGTELPTKNGTRDGWQCILSRHLYISSSSGKYIRLFYFDRCKVISYIQVEQVKSVDKDHPCESRRLVICKRSTTDLQPFVNSIWKTGKPTTTVLKGKWDSDNSTKVPKFPSSRITYDNWFPY